MERLFFDPVKKDRGWYFVEYRPPISSYRFATLSLVLPEFSVPEKVAEAMEIELKIWLTVYPIPLMISASDATGELYDLSTVRPCDFLIGFQDPITKDTCAFWRLVENDEIPDDALNTDYLKQMYSDISYRTSDDISRESARSAKGIRRWWKIVFVWTVVLPAIWAIVEWASPSWLALLVLIYALGKAVEKTLKMLGEWKKSRRELEKEEDERLMRHHHYHCMRNPEGFVRLKVENFEREERERTRAEAQALKAQENERKKNDESGL